MRNKRLWGPVLMAAGLTLIACALLMMGNNMREQARGERSASQALAQLQLAIQATSAPQDATHIAEEAPLPEAAVQASGSTSLPASAAGDNAHAPTPVPENAALDASAEAPLRGNAAPTVSVAAPAPSGMAAAPSAENAGTANQTHSPENTFPAGSPVTPMPGKAAGASPTAAPGFATAGPTTGMTPELTAPAATVQVGSAASPVRPVLPIYTPEPTPEPLFIQNPDMEMPVEEIGGNEYIGILTIPSLGLELPVMSDWSYPKLRAAPCRYAGSAYAGDLIISGHNYDRHFGGLWKLRLDDEIRFTDVDGHVFVYRVCKTETLKKTDVQKMRAGDWDMTLFTCTYGGKNRVTVRCEFVRYG